MRHVINRDGIIRRGRRCVDSMRRRKKKSTIQRVLFCFFQCDCVAKRRRRTVTCVRNGKLINDHECSREPKPDDTISCYDECVATRWEAQPWQPVRLFSFDARRSLFPPFSAQRPVRLIRVFTIAVFSATIMAQSFETNIVNSRANLPNTSGVRPMSVVQLGRWANGHQ